MYGQRNFCSLNEESRSTCHHLLLQEEPHFGDEMAFGCVRNFQDALVLNKAEGQNISMMHG